MLMMRVTYLGRICVYQFCSIRLDCVASGPAGEYVAILSRGHLWISGPNLTYFRVYLGLSSSVAIFAWHHGSIFE